MGYAGQISALESLSPAWAGARETLLKAWLHYGPVDIEEKESA